MSVVTFNAVPMEHLETVSSYGLGKGRISLAIFRVNFLLAFQGQKRKLALLEYFHATGKAKINAVT